MLRTRSRIRSSSTSAPHPSAPRGSSLPSSRAPVRQLCVRLSTKQRTFDRTFLARPKSLLNASSKRTPCAANHRPVTRAWATPCAFRGTSRWPWTMPALL